MILARIIEGAEQVRDERGYTEVALVRPDLFLKLCLEVNAVPVTGEVAVMFRGEPMRIRPAAHVVDGTSAHYMSAPEARRQASA